MGALEALHCALEVFVFPLRMSRFYFAHTERLQRTINSKGGCCLRPLLSLLCDESSYHIWSVRLCIDYTLTRIAAIGSAVGYLFGALWLRYGYNAYFYDVHTVSDAQFDKTIAFTAVALGIELVLFFITRQFMLYAYQIDIRRHWNGLIQHRSGYVWFFVFLLQHVQTDVMIAKLININV